MSQIAGNERIIQITVGDATLEGNLYVPSNATGLILFAHGGGSSRFSPRNRQVAALFNASNLGTLLLDLLTPREVDIDYVTRRLRFDIDLLGRRVLYATDWILQQQRLQDLPLGYFGASTGAAAALRAAAERPDTVRVVVSRGGRPDLAISVLDAVRAPTLLIVGGLDTQVIAMNQAALEHLQCKKELTIVPDASPLFAEPGKLEEVADRARNWFEAHLKPEVVYGD